MPQTKRLTYALVCEGSTDLMPYQILLQRMARTANIELIYQAHLSSPVAGPLSLIQVRLRTSQIFVKNSVDLAFFFSDRDKNEPDKSKVVTDGIKSVNLLYLDSSVIGVPDPDIEGWLLGDDNAVKKVFGLSDSDPIPYPELSGKPRLLALSSSCGLEELTPPAARKQLAEQLNLITLERNNTSFNGFAGDYKAFFNRINSGA